jgi:hypothetical protein
MAISLQIFFSVQGGGESRRTRPQDLIRLYEIILQNYNELQQLPGLDDDLQYQQEIETKTKAYRAFRYSSRICFLCLMSPILCLTFRMRIPDLSPGTP